MGAKTYHRRSQSLLYVPEASDQPDRQPEFVECSEPFKGQRQQQVGEAEGQILEHQESITSKSPRVPQGGSSWSHL
jgi:hypothetical protein